MVPRHSRATPTDTLLPAPPFFRSYLSRLYPCRRTQRHAIHGRDRRFGPADGAAAKRRRLEICCLVHAEAFADVTEAIAREKAIKKWRRAWKLELIERDNPQWLDLYERLNG